MALETTPNSGIWNSIKGALGVFDKLNKAESTQDNVDNVPEDEYESKMSEEDIISLTREWKKQWNVYNQDIEPSQKKAFEYWIGKQPAEEEGFTTGKTSLVDNKIFEALETFLPIATRANPDPLVQSSPDDVSQQVASDVKQALVYEADRQKLRMKIKKLARHWAIYRLGVVKLVYDTALDEIETQIINPKRMILDKDGCWDEAGHFKGVYIGERKRLSAEDLIELFPKKGQMVKEKVSNRLGTKVDFIEWWYCDTDVFFTMDDHVLGKYKNPHWNYDGETTRIDPETQAEIKEPIQGKNHFKKMLSPYIGLSIFSTGLQPHDETSLILQNVGLQDMVNRRYRQIDKNIDSMNNGLVVSGQSFTEEQASQAATALRKGIAIRVPSGDVRTVVQRFSAEGLPNDVFAMLKDGRQELSGVFGTSGSTSQGIANQESVRGKIMVNQMDSTRIGGGITEYLEQIADSVYNYWVQMMFVHWTDEHYINAIGVNGGQELIMLKNTMFLGVKSLNITVKEGSLIPKDPLTKRNEAMDLWSAGAIDPRSLFVKLDSSDPDEATNQLILWQMLQKGQIPPQAYSPSFQIAPQAQPQGQVPPQGVGGPAVNPLGSTQNEVQTPPPQGTQGAEATQSKQLLESVPIK